LAIRKSDNRAATSGCDMRGRQCIPTVPLHNPLKTGTLDGILSEVAQARAVTIESIAALL